MACLFTGFVVLRKLSLDSSLKFCVFCPCSGCRTSVTALVFSQSAASSRWMFGGEIPSELVDFRKWSVLGQPVTKRLDSLSMVSICFGWMDLLRTLLTNSPAEKQSDNADICNVCALVPHRGPMAYESPEYIVPCSNFLLSFIKMVFIR
ncbi:unnamed protein product [Macrosiphum euphorbiae]|uniref:Secreted protein n=1 Tax=Macrosiphum euphorbiae TaxID=13131 RepID=A0AAV0VU53_9HEMI|nr:unnamed protein product [Macrosiphum euphorbiae]